MNQTKDIMKVNLSGVSFCKADDCWGRLVAGGGVESNKAVAGINLAGNGET